MARIDRVIAAGRTYSILFLTLAIATTAVAATDINRWITLSEAREALVHWIVCDFIAEDFEDWWSAQQANGHAVTDVFQISKDLQTSRERYYTGFGSAVVAKQHADWSVSVRQPTRSTAATQAVGSIPDVRAEIPDLLAWNLRIRSSDIPSTVFSRASNVDSAIELGVIALNREFKKNNPEKAAVLPTILREEWSADARWLTLESEKEKAALQLKEIVRAAKVVTPVDSQPPASYRELERAFLTSTVRVPVIDVEVPTQSALWLLACLVLLNCLVLQVTLTELNLGDIEQREEPWLMLDGRSGLARVLSNLWLAVTVVSPVMVPSAVLLTLALRARTGGLSATRVLAAASFLVSLAVVGGWCSMKTYRLLQSVNSRLQRR